MLKLTTTDGVAVYISPLHISAICQRSSGNTDVRFAGGSYSVKETPDHILAMDDMVCFMNPAMVVKL